MEDNIQSLIAMGFIDRDLNRKALTKTNNDIGEAISILTNPNYFIDDVIIPPETSTSTFIGPLTKEQVEQQQQQQMVRKKNATKEKKRKEDKKREKKINIFLEFYFIYFCHFTRYGSSEKEIFT